MNQKEIPPIRRKSVRNKLENHSKNNRFKSDSSKELHIKSISGEEMNEGEDEEDEAAVMADNVADLLNEPISVEGDKYSINTYGKQNTFKWKQLFMFFKNKNLK